MCKFFSHSESNSCEKNRISTVNKIDVSNYLVSIFVEILLSRFEICHECMVKSTRVHPTRLQKTNMNLRIKYNATVSLVKFCSLKDYITPIAMLDQLWEMNNKLRNFFDLFQQL